MSEAAGRRSLCKLSKRRLLDVFYFQIRNIWRVDGLYFLRIKKEFGTAAASEIDQDCWKTMGALEARQLKQMIGAKKWTIPTVMKALGLTSWALDQRDKQVQIERERAILRVVSCHTQLTRLKKGLKEFPCRPVREGYLAAFAKELNPRVTVTCRICPPGKHPENTWCEWQFTTPEQLDSIG